VESVDWILNGGEEKPRRISPAEAAIAIWRPLHWGADPIAIAEVDFVAHPDFVAIIDNGCSRHRQEQRIEELDLTAVVLEQWRQSAADAEIEPGPLVGGIKRPKIIGLLIRHHFKSELIMIAQEDCPLRILGRVWSLAHDVGDRVAVFERQ